MMPQRLLCGASEPDLSRPGLSDHYAVVGSWMSYDCVWTWHAGFLAVAAPVMIITVPTSRASEPMRCMDDRAHRSGLCVGAPFRGGGSR